MWMGLQQNVFTYYGAFLWGEATMIMSGFGYSIDKATGAECFNSVRTVRVLKIVLIQNLPDFATNWNI